MSEQDPVLAELREMKRYLAILSTLALRPALSTFEQEVLRTNNRVRIFRAFNGERTPDEVGKMGGVTGQSVRELIKDLRKKHYVTVPSSGAQVASVNHEAILDWYSSQPSDTQS